jgi:hypothetical protein
MTPAFYGSLVALQMTTALATYLPVARFVDRVTTGRSSA